MKINKFLYLIALISLMGCSETIYTGQAFVKMGTETEKISDMDVFIASTKDLKNINNEYRVGVDLVASKLKAAKTDLLKIKVRLEENNNIAKIIAEDEAQLKPIDPSILKSVKSSLEEINKSLAEKKLSLDSEIIKLKSGIHPSIYLDYAEKIAITKVKTDADGKFILKSKINDGLVFIARRGQYYWYVSPPKNTIEIILADSNLHLTKCESCYFDGEQTKDLRAELAAYALEKININENAEVISEIFDNEISLSNDVQAQALKNKAISVRYGKLVKDDAYLTVLASAGVGTAEARGKHHQSAITLEKDIINYRTANDANVKKLLKNTNQLKSELEKLF